MPEQVSGERTSTAAAERYHIYGEPGYFTVNFTSPHNSLHQISGFKTEEDAHAWIAETKKLLFGAYR
jgi:hypothetical protein